jgi:hypothetical protein
VTDHLHDAGEVIAKAVKATADPHGGWLKYAPAGDAAVKELLAAGWTPPGDGSADERLRETLRTQQDEASRAWKNAHRIEAERDGADAFRVRFLDLWRQLQEQLAAAREAALIAHEPEPTYTSEQVLKWLQRILDLSDNAADRAKTRGLESRSAP